MKPNPPRQWNNQTKLLLNALSYAIIKSMDQQNLITSLIDRGWYVCENYLNTELCEGLLKDLHSSKLSPARVGKGHNKQRQEDIRNDSICWLYENQSVFQDQYLKKINQLMNLLNSELFLGLKQFEGHFALYQKKGFYKKHLDQFEKNSERQVSVVSYLNTPVDGGELRIFNRDNHHEIDVQVTPKAGTCVCFLSDQIYHEVLPTLNERYSIAGWLRTNIL